MLSFCLLLTLNSPCLAETYRFLLPFLALNTPFKSLHFIIVVVSFFFLLSSIYFEDLSTFWVSDFPTLLLGFMAII